MNWLPLTSVTIAFVAIFGGLQKGTANATDVTYIACIYGINDANSKSCAQFGPGGVPKYDARFLCHAAQDSIGHQLCDIRHNYYTDTIVVPFDAKVTSDVKGGECGFTTVQVTCHRPIDPIADFRRPDDLPCSESFEAAALGYCGSHSPPTDRYTVFAWQAQSGKHCGREYVRILCYRPPQ
jgi:hypothetical protein